MQKKFRIFTMVLALAFAVCSLAVFAACTDKNDSSENVTVTVSSKAIELEIGESQKLTVSVEPADAADKTVEWKTSDDKIATVDNGLVTAVAEGEATITVTSNGKSDSCKVTVKAAGTGGDSSGDSSSAGDSSSGSSADSTGSGS